MSRPKIKKTIKGKPLAFTCPCGAKIAVSERPYSVIHGVPICADFDRLGPLEFLAFVRRHHGIPDPPKEN